MSLLLMVEAPGLQLAGAEFERSESRWWRQRNLLAIFASVSHKNDPTVFPALQKVTISIMKDYFYRSKNQKQRKMLINHNVLM